MSRVGKLPVALPMKVMVNFVDEGALGTVCQVKGPLGELNKRFPKEITLAKNGESLVVSINNKNSKIARSLYGTCRAVLNNMVKGVSEGFTVVLEMVGVGYKVVENDKGVLMISVGYSHPIYFSVPAGISYKIEKPTVISFSSFDKELLGQTAAVIRSLRAPSVYKGKGIRYQGEKVIIKEGKKK